MDCRFRTRLQDDDPERLAQLCRATGYFSLPELAVAREVAIAACNAAEDYRFVLAEQGKDLLGYTCFGAIPCTSASWDVYWLAVRPESQGAGLGRTLLRRSELAVRAAGGTRIYIDTASRAQYANTHRFYERCGYAVHASLPDFYAPGDGKLIFCKVL